jgi:hypothetical protein
VKRFFAVCLFGLGFVLVGCGGAKEPSNIMEGVDKAAVQSYEEMVAADEAAMSSDSADAETADK